MASNQLVPRNSQVPAKPAKKIDVLRDLLTRSQEQIAMALPRHMDPEKMIRVAITALQKTPQLQECDTLSVIGAVIEASQLGLYPDGILGEAYLVPYKGKCQLQAGYRGYINLARRSGQVSWIAAELVFACDKFSVKLGDERKLIHEPDYDNPDRGAFDEGGELLDLRGAYAVVKFKDGTTDFEYMPLAQLNQIRNMSKAKNSQFSPWNTPEARPEMYRKIPVRRLAKRLPLSPEFQKAAVIDEYVDVGVGPDTSDHVDKSSEVARLASEQAMENLKDKYALPQPVAEVIDQIPPDEFNQDVPMPSESENPTAPAPEPEPQPVTANSNVADSIHRTRGRSARVPNSTEIFGEPRGGR